jgi:hypothetical protein
MARFLGCYVPSILDYSRPLEQQTKPREKTPYEIWAEADHTVWAPCVGSCGNACFNHQCPSNNNGYIQALRKVE